MSVANILRVFEQADAIDIREGREAYPRYNAMAARIAEQYGAPLRAVAGALSALSPNNDYLGNMRSLCSVLHGRREGWREDECAVTTYHVNRAKAWRILDGADPLDVLGGEKTRAFFCNIADPLNGYHVTIDGHMVGVWRGERLRMSEAGMRAGEYARIADGFRQAAGDLHWLPCQLQACLWFAWKRLHNVVYSGQLGLFCPGDQWQIERDLDELTRFASGPFSREKKPLAIRRKRSTIAKDLTASNPDESQNNLAAGMAPQGGSTHSGGFVLLP